MFWKKNQPEQAVNMLNQPHEWLYCVFCPNRNFGTVGSDASSTIGSLVRHIISKHSEEFIENSKKEAL